MNQIEYKGYIGSAEVDVADGILHGKLLFISDVVTYEASSIKELQINFHEAVDSYLKLCKELGDIPDTPCKGSFNIRIGPDLHIQCAIAANLNNISLNDWIRKACEKSINDAPRKLAASTNKERVINISTDINEDIIQTSQTENNGVEKSWQQTIQLH